MKFPELPHAAWVLSAAVAFAVSCVTAECVFAEEIPANDYPTVARADYVYACMATNGQTRDILEKCSCSIDQIAAVLPWSEYEEAETIMSVVQRGGYVADTMRSPQMQEKVKNLKRAQVEGELRCF
jgi:hypothetical protein